MSYNRSLARTIAHVNMKKHGYTQINKRKADGSLFSSMWREYVNERRK